jgi:hypothetical protein
MSESWWDEPLNIYSLQGDEELSVEEIDETLERIEAETASRWGKPTPKCKACGRETRAATSSKWYWSVHWMRETGFSRPCAVGRTQGEVVTMIHFDTLVKEMRKVAGPGRVTTVSYDGLKFALECGIDVWDFAETLTLARVIEDIGTPEQKQRLKEEILWMEDVEAWREAT